MPFAFLIIGAVFLVAGFRGQGKNLVSLIKGDFTGTNNYIYWTITILIIGTIGYVPALKTVSRYFIALVVVVLLIKEGNPNGTGGGFFSEFNKAISGTQNSTVTVKPSGYAATGPDGTVYTDTTVGSALQDLGTYGTNGVTTNSIQTTDPVLTSTL